MKKYHIVYLISVFILIVTGAVAFVISYKFQINKKPTRLSDLPKVVNFEECSRAGYPILESYPRKCRAANGEIFTENINSTDNKDDLIRIVRPQPNQVIKSPLDVSGEARGSWFFEASFPISLIDSEGNEIATGVAKTESDWMTQDFVTFTATITFKKPETKSGELVLKKDNPSGLVENEGELRIPIHFE